MSYCSQKVGSIGSRCSSACSTSRAPYEHTLGYRRCLQHGPLEPTQGSNEARQAGTPQWHIGFPGLPAETLHDRDGIVTDAIDWKEDSVGTAHNPGEQTFTLLHTAIVVQPFSLCALDKGPNVMDVPETSPDVEKSSSLERGETAPLTIRVRTLRGRELCFGSSQFVTQVLGMFIGVAQRCVGLRQGRTQHLMPLFCAFAPPCFGCKALLQRRHQFAQGHDLIGLFLRTW